MSPNIGLTNGNEALPSWAAARARDPSIGIVNNANERSPKERKIVRQIAMCHSSFIYAELSDYQDCIAQVKNRADVWQLGVPRWDLGCGEIADIIGRSHRRGERLAAMIAAEERKHLEELRSRVACLRKFACINSALTDLCKGEYHGDVDVMECLDQSQPPCNLASMSGCMRVCNCPLRKYIAQHFSQWAAESTALLGPAREN